MIVNNHAVLILTVKGELRMGLIDLFQKTRETSMEMKPQEDEAAKVVTCKGCGAELKAYAYGKNLYVYCCNNPVNAVDEDGSFGIWILKFEPTTPWKLVREVAIGMLVYAVQCGLANEKVTLEGLVEAAIESAVGCVLGGGGAIIFSIVTNGAKGFYSEYQESGNITRAMGAGVYDAIMTVFELKTYNVCVKNDAIEDALSAFTDLFQSPLLSYPKSDVLDGMFGKPKKQANKNGSTLKKNSNINFSTKKVGGKKKNWQSNKPAISRKMQNIGLPALR